MNAMAFESATQSLLNRYLDELSDPVGPVLPDGTRRARAGKGTRGTFRQSIGSFRASRKSWEAFCAAPLDTIWAWSDLHLNHPNILRYGPRPMADVDQMNAQLLEAAQVVPADHWLLFGGDLFVKRYPELREWMDLCPGRKVLILGNHDKPIVNRWQELGFEAASSVLSHVLADPVRSPLVEGMVRQLWWTHYPMDPRRIPAGTLNLHGHIHGHWLDGPRLNLSVERHDFAPRRLTDLLAMERPADTVSRDPHEDRDDDER